MHCRRCGTPLEKPGDYCLTCHTENSDAVVVEFTPDRAELTMLDEDAVVGHTTVTTRPEDDDELSGVQLRNFAGRVADEIRRKRPETVYAAGARDPLRETRAQLHHEFYRVPDGDAAGGGGTAGGSGAAGGGTAGGDGSEPTTTGPWSRGCSTAAGTARWRWSRRRHARRSAGRTRRSSAGGRGDSRSVPSPTIHT